MRVPRAQLRVFVPLESFGPDERQRWHDYVRSDGGLSRAEHVRAESAYAAQMLLGRRAPADSAALVRRRGDEVLLCPLDLDVRSAVAFEMFKESVPAVVADACIPSDEVRGMLEPFTLSARAPYTLEEAWVVPLHWFLAFSPADRRIREHPEGHGARIVYVTQIDQALDRLDEAIAAAEQTRHDAEDLLEGAISIAAWIGQFDAGSLLELDYAGVASLFSSDELRDDDSCERMWALVNALTEGDDDVVREGYDSLRARWGHRWALQHAN